MGDVVSLVEKAQDVIDEKDAKNLAKKIMNNKFDLDDFLKQLRTIKKLGPITDIMKMIPGMNKLPMDNFDPRDLVRVEAVLSSMTPKERKYPKILNGSRRSRIARGSGTSSQQVNQVLKQFDEMKKMMKQMTQMTKKMGGKGMPKMPGMFG